MEERRDLIQAARSLSSQSRFTIRSMTRAGKRGDVPNPPVADNDAGHALLNELKNNLCAAGDAVSVFDELVPPAGPMFRQRTTCEKFDAVAPAIEFVNQLAKVNGLSRMLSAFDGLYGIDQVGHVGQTTSARGEQ